MSTLITTRDIVKRESVKNNLREIVLENDDVADELVFDHLKDWIYEYFALEFTSNYEIEKKIEYDDENSILIMTFKVTVPILDKPEDKIKKDQELFDTSLEEFEKHYIEFRKKVDIQ